jgi:nicotinamidase-related amidase
MSTTPSQSSAGPSAPSQSSSAASPLRLVREQALVLCVDVQERLSAALPEELLRRMRKNAAILLRGAAALGVPVLVSEQYKKGLGDTLPDLVAALPDGTQRLEKLEFSAWAAAPIAQAIIASGRSQLIVFGMETHICVFQTVRDLCHTGYTVHVPHDAVASRDPENLRLGLVLAERAGAVVTAVETVLFDLLHRAGSPEFKAISALVK